MSRRARWPHETGYRSTAPTLKVEPAAIFFESQDPVLEAIHNTIVIGVIYVAFETRVPSILKCVADLRSSFALVLNDGRKDEDDEEHV